MVASYAIGIDVGATRIAAGLVDSKGRVITDIVMPTPKERGPFGIVDAIITAGKEVSERFSLSEIAGIGIGLPAQVDFSRQEIEFCTNLPILGVDVRSLVEAAFRLPVTIDNDGNLAALGECRYGAGKKISDFVMITLGTGVGGGLWLNGHPYRGVRGLGSEIGHMVVELDGPPCPCGGRGHLESYLGSPAIKARARAAAEKPSGKAIYDAAGDKLANVDAHALLMAARGGDRVALSILTELGEILGQALVSLVNIFNPKMICIGGGIGESADELVRSAAHIVDTQALAGRKDVRVVQATLGNDAGTLGAAALAFEEYEAREGFCL